MARPKIRHLAIFARNPRALAEFYRDVLEMEIINSEPDGSAFFVSDGYLTWRCSRIVSKAQRRSGSITSASRSTT